MSTAKEGPKRRWNVDREAMETGISNLALCHIRKPCSVPDLGTAQEQKLL